MIANGSRSCQRNKVARALADGHNAALLPGKFTMKQAIVHVLAALVAILFAGPVYADASAEFNELLDEFWENRMADFPTFASSLGDRRYNDQ